MSEGSCSKQLTSMHMIIINAAASLSSMKIM